MLTSVRARTRTHQSARSTSVLIIDARFQVSGSLDLWQATAAWSTLDRKMTMARRMVAISVGAALCGVNGNMIDVILPEMVPPANCPHGCMEVCSWRAKQSGCPTFMPSTCTISLRELFTPSPSCPTQALASRACLVRRITAWMTHFEKTHRESHDVTRAHNTHKHSLPHNRSLELTHKQLLLAHIDACALDRSAVVGGSC